MADQELSTSLPSGVTSPKPVITTLLPYTAPLSRTDE
jgi:hypothetical protein